MSELEEFLRGAAQLRQPRPVQSDEAAEAPLQRLAAAPSPLQPMAAADMGSQLRLGPEHLAQVVDQADERMAARLHDKFDHQVGRLGQEVVSQEEDIALASKLAMLLSQPQSLRQAIILTEVLRSPVERWERS